MMKTATLLLLQILLVSASQADAFATQQRRVYKHLFRHYDDISFDSWLRCADPLEFLHSIGYSDTDIARLQQTHPKLLDQNVHSQLAPKVRFLRETCRGGEGALNWASEEAANHAFDSHDDDEPCLVGEERQDSLHTLRLSEQTIAVVPGSFYQSQLDRSLGPKHAYLQHHSIHPNGSELLRDSEKFTTFLDACKSMDTFVKLCNDWDDNQQQQHTVAQLDRFERDFYPGLVPAAQGRNDLPLELLLQHGANHLEHDPNGVMPLHWAAGSGHPGIQALLEAHCTAYDPFFTGESDKCAEVILNERGAKDGATPLHWACCGVRLGNIGDGGSFETCRLFLEKSGERRSEVANVATYRGSTPFHWAAWGGNTAIMELLALHGADAHAVNHQNANAAHFAASSGQLKALEYLNELHVDLTQQNDEGKTPLDLAEEASHQKVVEWLTIHIIRNHHAAREKSPLATRRSTSTKTLQAMAARNLLFQTRLIY